jgi:hypothetical protein
MLKQPASIVLTSFRSSTYPRGYASGPSLAAALLDGLFEHPSTTLARSSHGDSVILICIRYRDKPRGRE